MSSLQIFSFDEQALRTVEMNKEIWFVARDVCNILDIKNTSDALKRLDEDERARFNLGRQGEANIVNESGIYELIFASRKEEAKDFKRWLKRDVLPAIRKTGSYQAENKPMTVEEMIISQAESVKEVKQDLQELSSKVDNQITLDHGEQRRLQKALAIRVYSLTEDLSERKKLFSQGHREIKDRFGVSSYKDVKRKDLQAAVNYIANWIPKKVA